MPLVQNLPESAAGTRRAIILSAPGVALPARELM
jgi:hypothetical protein